MIASDIGTVVTNQTESGLTKFLKEWASPAIVVSLIAGTWIVSNAICDAKLSVVVSLGDVKSDVKVLQSQMEAQTKALDEIKAQGAETSKALQNVQLLLADQNRR